MINAVKDNLTSIIDELTVRRFGTKVIRNTDKFGNFKSFGQYSWIETFDGNTYTVDKTINELKNIFPFYDSRRKEVIDFKKGKEVKKKEWICDVLDDISTPIPRHKFEEVKEALQKKVMFYIDKYIPYYPIIRKVYRYADSENYAYVDIDKKLIIDTKLQQGNCTLKDLEDWVVNYEGEA